MDIRELYTQIRQATGVSTDTRTLKPGMVFFALKGDTFDANEMVEHALDTGSSLVVTQNPAFRDNPSCFFTPDTLLTLQQVATYHRHQLGTIIIGITGTNGKTTTKELIREALSTLGSVQATRGNLNNHIGVPLTLLEIQPDTRFAVVEMGANHPGEIEQLCTLASPDYGVITNIGRAHLEGFGSFEGVVQTKSELYRFIQSKGKGVFVNEEDPLLMSLSEKQSRIVYGRKSYLVTLKNTNTPQLSFEWESNGVHCDIESNLIGQYNLSNMLAALGIGLYFGGDPIEMSLKLSAYQPSNMRSQWIDTGRNTLILDAYNANPSSMNSALDNFTTLQATKKMAILGDMLELGSYSDDEHFAILEKAAAMKLNSVVLIGPRFGQFQNQFPSFLFMANTSDARQAFSTMKINGFTVLLKGSRGIGVDALKDIF